MAADETSKSDKDAAEKELKKTYLGAYNLESEGIAIIDQDGDTFLKKALNIVDKWGWDDKTKSVIDALPDGDKVFQSMSYVKFDAANWKITGAFAKLADGKGRKKNKTSLYVATSKFEFIIQEMREKEILLINIWVDLVVPYHRKLCIILKLY